MAGGERVLETEANNFRVDGGWTWCWGLCVAVHEASALFEITDQSLGCERVDDVAFVNVIGCGCQLDSQLAVGSVGNDPHNAGRGNTGL